MTLRLAGEVALVALPLAAVAALAPVTGAGLWRRLGWLAAGVLVLEPVVDPLWDISMSGRWAFVYGDVAWVLAVAGAGLLVLATVTIDLAFPHLAEPRRLWLYALFVAGLGLPLAALLESAGLRRPSRLALSASLTGASVPLTPLPIETVLWLPLWGLVVLGPYLYLRRVLALEGGPPPPPVPAHVHRLARRAAGVVLDVGLLAAVLSAGQMVFATFSGAGPPGASMADRLGETALFAALPVIVVSWRRSLPRSQLG